MSEQQLPPYLVGAFEISRTFARNAFKAYGTEEGASKLIRKIDVYVDKEVARVQDESKFKLDCKIDCDYCCYRQILATIPEIITVYNHINANFSDEEKQALKMRLNTHEEEIIKFESGSERYIRTVCPLLVNHRCSVYADRPLTCRMANSFDVDSCKASALFPEEAVVIPTLETQAGICAMAMQGIIEGLGPTFVANGQYDLGRALKRLLDNPQLVDSVLNGRATFPSILPEKPPLRIPVRPGDVTGQFSDDEAMVAARDRFNAHDFEAGIAVLTKKSPVHLLNKLSIPSIYKSEQEILDWRAHFERSLDELIAADLDPAEAFNGLRSFNTFNLAYQGLSVKDTLAKLGNWVTNTVASKALPHLVERQTTKRRPGKYRVGYISASLGASNASQWALGWMQNHGDAIETFAFNVGTKNDPVTRRFGQTAHNYYHLQGNVQREAELIRQLDLDVLIFTDIGMAGSDYQFGSLRLARVQCSAWGHPVTSGLPNIDYYLSSDYMEPADAQDEYTETLVRLPRSGLCMPRKTVPISSKSREQLQLPEGYLPVMAQNLQKWLPQDDFIFEAIRDKMGSKIAFFTFNRHHEARVFLDRLEAKSIPWVMLGGVTPFDYNRVVQLSDVSFDPLQWSGGNSCIEALSAGTPVATLPGRFMRGRHSLAFLKIAGAEGLIAKDADDYIDLITNPERCREALKGSHPEALYEDVEVVRALDEFLISAVEKVQ